MITRFPSSTAVFPMIEVNTVHHRIQDMKGRARALRGYL